MCPLCRNIILENEITTLHQHSRTVLHHLILILFCFLMELMELNIDFADANDLCLLLSIIYDGKTFSRQVFMWIFL